MKSLIKLVYCISLLTTLIAFSGCASSDQAQQTEDGRVSTIPWNRPQRWEGSGQLGGMMQQ